jgi:tetratricopeptide (TPR) repeat protein
MKIPLRELEEARQNPDAYLNKKSNANGLGFNPRSKFRVFVMAIYNFHRSGNDLSKAQDYLEKGFNKFKSQKDLIPYIHLLEHYASDFKDSGAVVFKVRDNISVPLNSKFKKAGFRLSGEIPRLDITSDGYAAWLFSNKAVDWKNELRLPIIQGAYAELLNVEIQDIKVNTYDFSQQLENSFQFTKWRITKARRELNKLLKMIQNLQKP